jgi:hypothetical protein
VTLIDRRADGSTVRTVWPATDPREPRIVVVPGVRALASPAALTVATPGPEEVQTTDVVMSCVLPSLEVPVAMNCCVVPLAMEGLAGVTAMEVSTAGPTVRVVEPVTEPEVAEMVEVPTPAPEATPVAEIVATEVLEETQVTAEVRSVVVPSL